MRAAFSAAAGGGLDFVVRLGSTFILARLISPEHFGLITMVTTVTAFADQFRDLGLSAATVQRQRITHDEVTNLFWINLLAGTVVAGIVGLSAPAIAAFFKEPRLTAITLAIALNFIWGGLTVQHESLLTRQMKMGEIAIVRLAANFLSTIFAIILALKGFDYWALAWREVARNALVAVGMWLYCPWIPGLPRRRTPIGDLLRFGGNLTTSNILTMIVASLDRVVIGRFFGPVPVAMYRQAYQLVVAPIDQLQNPIYHVCQPGLSMLQANPARYLLFYRKVLAVVSLLTMPLCMFMAVYAPEIVLVLLGQKWAEAAPFFRVLSIGAFIKSSLSTSGMVLITMGRSRKYLAIGLANSALIVVSVFVGLHWGPIGIAIAQSAAIYAMIFPTLLYSFQASTVSVRDFLSAVYRPVLASVAMAAGLLVFRSFVSFPSFVVALIAGLAAAAFLFAIAFVLIPGGRQELASHLKDLAAALQRKGLGVPKMAPVGN